MDNEEIEVQVSIGRQQKGMAGWVGDRGGIPCPALTAHCDLQKEVAKMYSSFQVMYTTGYSLSLGALLLALAILLGLRYAITNKQHGQWRDRVAGMLTCCPHSKLHCTRNYIHGNLFASFVLKAGSVLVIDQLLKTRYSQKIGDDLRVSVWLSDGVSPG
jgi:glucagon receptor